MDQPDRRVAVIVGSAPPVQGEPPWMPEAGSTRSLAAMIRVPPADLYLHFGLANLISTWEGGVPVNVRGSGTNGPSRQELRRGADAFRLLPGFRYVLAGQHVVRALGKRGLPARLSDIALALGGGPPLLSWYESRGGATIAVLPHPSGQNRWYNVRGRRALAGAFLLSAMHVGEDPACEIWLRAVAATWSRGSSADARDDRGADDGLTEQLVACGRLSEETWTTA